ncbi:methyltransferase [Arabidopsis thaliana]|uniref:Methyltransferase n=1 Tax=Arabidopsis thaliana TaxID=3702 RepID=F4KI79_ARATH|nr:methyltransferase [Arabidopsis thaliana]NP_001318529.1 methyltransferase [Arabidopsis thaliana]AED91569.1 methyltransferase [Arabidopsis thaliana]AED91570.1 methyltransferase [Arabidopsis thaliana]|eukprot:NP_001190281.1 methyltransferase [Arabidopsis thaliana]
MSIVWLSLFSGSFTDIVLYKGVAYGHGRQLRKRANVAIRLSSMVLNHHIALVVLME